MSNIAVYFISFALAAIVTVGAYIVAHRIERRELRKTRRRYLRKINTGMTAHECMEVARSYNHQRDCLSRLIESHDRRVG